MSNQQQGCFWISGVLARVGRSKLILCGFLKKDPIITDHSTASQACNIWENHLTGDKLDSIFADGTICDRSSRKKAAFCVGYLQDKERTGGDAEQVAKKQFELNTTQIFDILFKMVND